MSLADIEQEQIENRKQLAWLVMRLFKHWQVDCDTKLNLLGLSKNSRALLKRFEEGMRPLPSTRDVIDRVTLLLNIHQNLRALYPDADVLCHTWVLKPCKLLNYAVPLTLMKDEGLIGIAKVAHLLNHLRTSA